MRLLLVPHAPTDWNAAGRFQGWSDPSLSDIGKRQAALVARRLQGERIDSCHSSDLRRARETATAIGEPHALPVTLDSRLREMHFGSWEGLTYGEIHSSDHQSVAAWEAEPMAVAPPGGETLTQLADRGTAFLASLTGVGQDKVRLVVAHRGSLRVLLCLALGLSPRAWWQFHLQPASVSELAFTTQGAVLHYLNDTHHLREETHDR